MAASILILSQTGGEGRLCYALPILLSHGFRVSVFIEYPENIKNLPSNIRGQVRVFTNTHCSVDFSWLRRRMGIGKVYLNLVEKWTKMRTLKDIADKSDVIFNVRANNLYDPILSPHSKTVYHLYSAMVHHPSAYRNYPKFLAKPYFALLDNIFLNRAKKAVVLANSHFIQTILLHKGITSEVVYPPCKTDDLYASPHKKDQVISVGRIAIEKKHEDTIRIAQRLPNVRFIILGEVSDVAYYRKLKRLAMSNVNFVTPTHKKFREYLRKYLAPSKIFLHSAEDDAAPISLVEAMASGCIPIVRNAGGPKEMVTDDAGFKWNSIEEAVEYISSLLADEKLQEKISLNAMKRSQAFAPDVYQKRIIEIIQRSI